MKAIVLSFDKYHPLSDFMIHCYNKLWPDNPFTFHVPYQESKDISHQNVKFVKTPKPFKDTVIALLEGLDDDEWVYWCPDEYYPVSLDIQAFKDIYEWLPTTSISGVLTIRPLKIRKKSSVNKKDFVIDNQGRKYYRRRLYQQVFVHQFIRVKALKKFFSHIPDVLENTSYIDQNKRNWKIPDNHRLYVIYKGIARFGELTRKGDFTINGIRDFEKEGFKLPEGFGFINKEIYRDDEYQKDSNNNN